MAKEWLDHEIRPVLEYLTPQTFLGEEDAKDEWNEENKAANLFLHTSSYKNFIQPNSIFLFGRRGTGKTAMMRMLKHEVNAKNSKYYSYVYIIGEENAYHNLATHIRSSPYANLPEPELVYQLTSKWLWIIMIGAMTSVVKAKHNLKDIDIKNDILSIKKYLNACAPDSAHVISSNHEMSPVAMALGVVIDELNAVDYSSTKFGAAILKITKRLFSPAYTEACQALARVIKSSEKLCLVMIDSIELYDLKDKIVQAVITALMEAARKVYGYRNNDGVIVKVAFPTEIYPRLSTLNQEKTEGKNLFILWQYRDLVSLLGKRYMQLIEGKNVSLADLESMDDHNKARGYLYKHLSPKIRTTTNIEFDTIAYIIRHTHKKPRQVILLLNIILTVAEKLGERIENISSQMVKHGIHARLDMLVNGTLDTYRMICPRLDELVKRGLTDAPSEFDYSRLDQQMKELHSLRRQIGIGSEDIKRLFLESGVIGIKRERHNFPNDNKILLAGLFEYQVKGTLFLTNKSICVIHPMFYQELHTDIDRDTFVYPMPAEEEEKEMLAEMGITLGNPT
ncbi:MAG: hypothetical protein WC770_02145 [Phycisphaerae bacterium]|jgi:hypothetical protein